MRAAHTHGANAAAAAAAMRPTCAPVLAPGRTKLDRRSGVLCRCQLGLLYASCTGSTRRAAQLIHQQLAPHCTQPVDLDSTPDLAALSRCSGYILGVPTWNTDASQQRSGTVWDDLLYNGGVARLQLQGKPVAVFGCGDAVRFKNTFADALAEVHDILQLHGAHPLGYVDPSPYLMKASKSIRGAHFLGLPLDNHNQPHLTEGRIQGWCQQLQQELLQCGWTTTSSSSSSAPSIPMAAGGGVLAEPEDTQHKQQHLQQHVAALEAQQQPPLYISSAPATWPRQAGFQGDYPRGFVFTDRWYQLGDRWYRFADQGFVVTAGFREHTPYTYAYSDVVHIRQVPPGHQWASAGMGHANTTTTSSSSSSSSGANVEVWLTVRTSAAPAHPQHRSHSSSSSGSWTKALVLKQVECWQAGSTSTIYSFLQHMCPHASCEVVLGAGAAAAVA